MGSESPETEEAEVGEEVVVIRDAGDPLSPGFLSSFGLGGREYLSVEHFQQSRLLEQMGLGAEAAAVRDAPTAQAARELADAAVASAVPPGLDPAYLASYKSLCRHAFVRQALQAKLAVPAFKDQLRKTANALLVLADPDDPDLGIGMDEVSFKYWMQQEGVSTAALHKAMLHPDAQPLVKEDGSPIGRNRLGLLLLQLRASLQRPSQPTPEKEPRPTFKDGEVEVSQLVVALRGPFLPLSNRYALPISVHGSKYKSVEHYVYYKFLSAYGTAEKEAEKCLRAHSAWKLHHAVDQLLDKDGPDFDDKAYKEACAKLERWYRKGMTTKLTKYPRLAQLLLATGDAIIVETSGQQDKEWSVGLSERELQSMFATKGLTVEDFLKYTTVGGEAPPTAFRQLGLNRSGHILMEMRAAMAGGAVEALSLIAPMDGTLPSLLSHHLICFTPASAFSPLKDAAIKHETVSFPSVQHFVLGKGAEALGMSPTVREAVLGTAEAHLASVRFAEELALLCPAPEKLEAWETTGAVDAMKTGLRLRIEQTPGLLRALLETGDALLAFCLRFFSSQLEWGIGMRERDLRAWMHQTKLSTAGLARLTSAPLAQRPPFLGGNRVGGLLMELRREFTLRGLFPQKMPELSQSPEQILGSESSLEDMDMWDDETGGQAALWPNPFLALAERSGDERLVSQATFCRASEPPWLRPGFVAAAAAREAEERELRSLPDEAAFASLGEDELDALSETQLRHVVCAYLGRLRGLRHAAAVQGHHLRNLHAELARLKRMRDQLHSQPQPGSQSQAPSGPPPQGPREQHSSGPPQQRPRPPQEEDREAQRNLRRVQERMNQLVQSSSDGPGPGHPQREREREREEREGQRRRRPPSPREPPPPRPASPAAAPAKPRTPPPPKQPRPDAEDGELTSSDDDA